MLIVENLLSDQTLKDISEIIQSVEFQDGKSTAGAQAQMVKNNEQAVFNQDPTEKIQNLVLAAIREDQIVRAGCMPIRLSPLLISRYKVGMEYGLHVDDPIQNGVTPMRTDISFTVFLNSPDDYEGGELTINNVNAALNVKLAAGSAVFYPSNSLHRVQPVTSIFDKDGKTDTFDTLTKTHSNLMRMWAEI